MGQYKDIIARCSRKINADYLASLTNETPIKHNANWLVVMISLDEFDQGRIRAYANVNKNMTMLYS